MSYTAKEIMDPEFSLVTLESLEKEPIALAKFTPEDAWELGVLARKVALEKYPSSSLTIDISTTTGMKLFRTVTGPDSTFDNDEWVRRKINVVQRFNASSFLMGRRMARKGSTLEKSRFVPATDYAEHGGCVPIRLIGSSFLLATLTFSGLKQEEDHLLALEVLGKFKRAQA